MGVLFFCSLNSFAQDWKDPQWQKILLYHKTLLGYESEADHSSFFASAEGKYHPDKELASLIEGVSKEEPDQHKNSFCRFPARVRWLKKFRQLPENKVVCEEYLKFKNRLAAKSISVVFSSYYLNNPGSTFGHTFIRLGKQTNEEKGENTATELLDTGINYGALTDGAGPVLFAIGGLAGWFSGNYNAVPYYYKVREYNDFETRDLWSYQLDMTQEEIDFIVDYIWELGTTRFDYFFLTENCSYHVLSILEAARPSLNLHDFMPGLYTIPAETLKALMAENLVHKITFRPSASTQFYQQLNLLSETEKKEVQELVSSQQTPSSTNPDRTALLYDTAISLVDYKYAKDILKGEEKAQNLKRPLLVARSKIPVRSPELDYADKMKVAPHLSHGQKRLMLGSLNRDNSNLMDVEWRFAFHDLLDNSIGYPPKTKLDVMKVLARTDGHQVQLREFDLVDVMTLGKWDPFNKASSWKLKLGQWQTRYEKRDLSTQGFSGGYGYALERSLFTTYVLAHFEGSYVSERLQRFKPGYGADLGILVDFTHAWKFQTVLEGRAHPWDDSRWLNELRYSNREYGFGVYHQSYLIDGMKETGLRIFRYL